MIIYYFKIAIRNLLSNKKYLINTVAGLSIGLAIFFLIILHVKFDLSYDKFFENSSSIYRVDYERYQKGVLQFKKAKSTYVIGPLLKEEIPEILDYTRAGIENGLIFRNNNKFNNVPILWVDSTFFNVIPLKIINGDPTTALIKPYTAVISKKFAEKIFGSTDPLDKTFYLNEYLPFTVTGIFENLPENTHLSFEVLVSLSTGNNFPRVSGWGTNSRSWNGDFWLYTYVKVNKGSDIKSINKKIEEVVAKNLPENLKSNSVLPKFTLTSIQDIHLKSNLEGEVKPNGKARNVYFMLLIGIAILIIAFINFINISIVNLTSKIKGLSVENVFGATGRLLILKHIIETLIIYLISIIMSIALIALLLPLYQNLVNRELSVFLNSNLHYYLVLMAIALAGAIISVIYPSFLILKNNPINGMKGCYSLENSKNSLRNILIVIQLVAATVMIFCLLVIYKQINYINNKEQGYNKEGIIIMAAPRNLNQDSTKSQKFETFENNLEKESNVISACVTLVSPGREVAADRRINKIDNKPIDEINIKTNSIDENFLKVYNVKLIAGENFEKLNDANRDNVLINKVATKALCFIDENDAIGHVLWQGNRALKIVGVIDDFNQESLYKTIQPTLFINRHPVDFGFYSIRVENQNISNTIQRIKRVWEELYPDAPFDYQFQDKFIEELYKQDIHFGRIIILFTVLSILITCLGLYSLILIISAKSSKSIGIRKINGAKTSDLIFLLIKSFIYKAIIALAIALPVSFLLMSKWLENFAYRTNISWWIFAASGCVTILITLLTVSWQSWRAAARNPVEALRSE